MYHVYIVHDRTLRTTRSVIVHRYIVSSNARIPDSEKQTKKQLRTSYQAFYPGTYYKKSKYTTAVRSKISSKLLFSRRVLLRSRALLRVCPQ